MIALRLSTSPAASHEPGVVRVAVGLAVATRVAVAGAGYGPGGSVGSGASVAVGPAVTVGPGTTAPTARTADTRPGSPDPAPSCVRASVPTGSRSPSATRSAIDPAVTGDAIDVPDSAR